MTDQKNNTSTESVQRALADAVEKALERKRKLGQYAVVWHDGRAVRLGIDIPWEDLAPGTSKASGTEEDYLR